MSTLSLEKGKEIHLFLVCNKSRTTAPAGPPPPPPPPPPPQKKKLMLGSIFGFEAFGAKTGDVFIIPDWKFC